MLLLQSSKTISDTDKIILAAIATLIPTAATALVKWTVVHSRKGRSVELTQRVSTLAKSIAELPALPALLTNPAVTPQSTLAIELNAALHELHAIQSKARHNFSGMSSIASTMRSMFLLFRPVGPLAWTLHLLFYGYLPCFILLMSAGWAASFLSKASDQAGDPSAVVLNSIFFIALFVILGIPPLILRYFALKLHNKQCPPPQIFIAAQ